MIATSHIHLLINPLHPNISVHILHTFLYTFPEVLIGGICFKIKELYELLVIFLILVILMFDSGVIL